MDINKLLDGIDCKCGKKHLCDIEYIYVEKGAIARLEELCRDKEKIIIVADENTYEAVGNKVDNALDGKTLEKVVFLGKTVLIPNEDAIEKVSEKLEGVELILGIGSGVIQDLCKCVSLYSKIPYMIVATAPSMDGYASTGAAMILKGMKETVPAGLPRAIVADIDILKDAPMEMIKAGYGDIIGKYSALCDWLLSREINNEYFCQYIYDTTMKMVEDTLKVAKGLLQRDEESIKILMESLVVVGIMMSFAGSSRPASGSEHHLSHFFEIVGIVNDEPYFPHGIDVAYSTIITAKIKEKLLNSVFPDSLYRVSREEYEEEIKKVYKSVADECIKLQDKVGNYSADRLNVYKEKEEAIRKILAETPNASQIEEMLSLAEYDISEFFEMYGEDKIKEAVKYAKDLKDRYTALWLNYDLFKGEL